MPTLSKSIRFASRLLFLIESPAIIPIANVPKKFIISVFVGKLLEFEIGVWLNKYLQTDPKKPPIPTIKHLIKYITP